MMAESHVLGENASEKTILSLQDWIKQEKLQGLSIERKISKPAQEHMGIDPITLLT